MGPGLLWTTELSVLRESASTLVRSKSRRPHPLKIIFVDLIYWGWALPAILREKRPIAMAELARLSFMTIIESGLIYKSWSSQGR
jgi:hypothetical protein